MRMAREQYRMAIPFGSASMTTADQPRTDAGRDMPSTDMGREMVDDFRQHGSMCAYVAAAMDPLTCSCGQLENILAIEAEAADAERVNDDEHWHRGPSKSCSICRFVHLDSPDPSRRME